MRKRNSNKCQIIIIMLIDGLRDAVCFSLSHSSFLPVLFWIFSLRPLLLFSVELERAEQNTEEIDVRVHPRRDVGWVGTGNERARTRAHSIALLTSSSSALMDWNCLRVVSSSSWLVYIPVLRNAEEQE
jgi:hypothetical protein